MFNLGEELGKTEGSLFLRPIATPEHSWDTELFVLRGQDREDLGRRVNAARLSSPQFRNQLEGSRLHAERRFGGGRQSVGAGCRISGRTANAPDHRCPAPRRPYTITNQRRCRHLLLRSATASRGRLGSSLPRRGGTIPQYAGRSMRAFS